MPFAERFSSLDGIGLLAAIAAGLAASAPDDVPPGDERTWERLLATDAWDAWLIRWPPGTSVGPHDHGGSSGAFSVVRGVLVEVVAGLAGPTVSIHRAGSARAFGPDIVHDVANVSEDPAVSVHVYSPPLTGMGRYEWSPSRTEAA
jgi:predicted metal-dependent enzyme (double-stranded beta helix superfamily)